MRATYNRLTHVQRDQLIDLIKLHEATIQSLKLTHPQIAENATEVLGFAVNQQNVKYACKLIRDERLAPPPSNPFKAVPHTPSPEYDHPEPSVPVLVEATADANTYVRANATTVHGRYKPWELTDSERTIEILERLRRVETYVKRMFLAAGLDDLSPSQPTRADRGYSLPSQIDD